MVTERQAGGYRVDQIAISILRRLPRRNGTHWRKDDRQCWAHVSLGRGARCISWLPQRSSFLLVLVALHDAVGDLPASVAQHHRAGPVCFSLGPPFDSLS